jgi:hypothetical protein
MEEEDGEMNLVGVAEVTDGTNLRSHNHSLIISHSLSTSHSLTQRIVILGDRMLTLDGTTILTGERGQVLKVIPNLDLEVLGTSQRINLGQVLHLLDGLRENPGLEIDLLPGLQSGVLGR